MSTSTDPNEVVQLLAQMQFGHLERRICTAQDPMQLADKDRYRWGHPDAKTLGPFFNLIKCECPHCGMVFTCLP